ncbi:hypothetical protein N7447_004372 [Penicillium robsamsonii]|uniref:uncharacterized protein n=1 Tax=Penicillium robsamsonii TaxID=1792511 RepID=UPI002548B076|nr:uncharacterized protein N7447_004372 [Penicillium robsamsonii]KAJ5827609.1 hypothetical protein N7447_004372 [Penicillium robsamsonii]
MSNRNASSDESVPNLGSIEGQNIQATAGGGNNNRNNRHRRRRNNSSYSRTSDHTPAGIEQVEIDAEPGGENDSRNNANNRRHNNSNNFHTSDDTPPGIERVESDAEGEGENIPVYEGDFSNEDDEAELFLQPMWSTPELLDHTAETSGLPMEGSVLAWRGNGTGKSVIVGYACGRFATARLIPAARRPIPSRAPNISEKSLARRKDYIRTERDIRGWGIVAWRVDKKSVDQDPISLLKPMSRAWYPETYVYIHWLGGDASWESRHDLRFVCAGNELKTDMLIYNVAKEQEANYREALTGVRPHYPPANTHMTNDHWRNVNSYRGAHWFQPRAEENKRITRIEYEPVIPRGDNYQEFDNGIGMSDSGTFQEVSEEYQEGYYEGLNEGSNEGEEIDNVEGGEEVQDDREQQYGDMQQRERDLSPIDEEVSVSEGGSFFTPNGSPSRVRWHSGTQQRYGIFTPRATRSPSSGIPQGNRDQARRMPETPNNRRIPHLNRGNQQRTPQSRQGSQQRQTPQSNRSNRSHQGNQPNQGGQQQQTPQSNQPDRQGSQQRQTPQSNRSNRSHQGNQPNQGGQQQQTPQSNQPDRQGSQQRQTPQSSRSNRSHQGGQQQQTPQSNQLDQGSQQRQTPQSSRSNRSHQGGQQQQTPQSNQLDQGSQQRQTPQSSRSNRSHQGGQQQQTPQSNQLDQGSQQRQTPQSSRSNRSHQGGQQQQTPQSNQLDQGSQQRQTPQSSRSNRSHQGGQQQQTPQSNQPDRQGSQQRQTPQSSRSNRSHQGGQQQQTPQSNQLDQGSQQRQTPQSSRSNRSHQGGQQQQTPQSNQPDRQGSQQRRTPQSSRSNRPNQPNHDNQRQRTPQSSQGIRPNQRNQIDHRSTDSNIAIPEGNHSPTQVRRGRGRPRRGDRTNIPSTIPIRRSTRLTSIQAPP